MFVPQGIFDAMLWPAIEDPQVRTIRFLLDERERTPGRAGDAEGRGMCRGREGGAADLVFHTETNAARTAG